jgi:16S rRNA (guanine527-N7)-methyltransferase
VSHFAQLLVSAGVERGLIGPAEPARIWTRHLLNCAWVHSLVAARSRVADIGSGAGLPGVVLAAVRPDLEVTLVEPSQRRCVFLAEAVAALDLRNVVVRRTRAEAEEPGSYDVAVARAVAALDRLAAWSLPWVRPGGRLLALKGATAAAEVADTQGGLARAGGRVLGLHEPTMRGVEDTTVVSVQRLPAPVRRKRRRR